MFPVDLQVWLNHFEYHAQHPREFAHDLSHNLSSTERRRIARSIAVFQRDEQSERHAFLSAAERFARQYQVPSLIRVIQLLIQEESRHAVALRRFMQDYGIALQERHWSDPAFRRTQPCASLEMWLHVTVCAELIGHVYYRALEAATTCPRLKKLCQALLAAKLAHVGFESELLLNLRARRGSAAQFLMRLTHRIFFAGSATVAWLTHRRVLRHAGYTGAGFLRGCFTQYDFYLESPVMTRRFPLPTPRQ